MRQVGSAGQCHFDRCQVVRLVQRGQRHQGFQRLHHCGIQADGLGEVLAAVHHPMAQTQQLDVRKLLLHRAQQVLQATGMAQ